MPKIAIISAHTSPLARLGAGDAGGMNVYIRELSNALSRKGFDIDIFTRSHAPDIPRVVQQNGLRVVYLKAGPQSLYPKRFFPRYFEEFLDQIVKFSRLNRYDLIHSHHWLSGWVSARLKQIWGVPMVHTFHTLGLLKSSDQYRLKIEKDTVRKANLVISTSDAEKSHLVQYYKAKPDKIHYIPCGVNVKLFKRLDPNSSRKYLGLSNQRYILFVGRIDPIKSIETLLSAMTLLDSTVHLLVIGGGERESEFERLKKRADRLGITDRVSFLGAKPQSLLPYYYSSAEVCILPSSYESFGLVLLEAMACGTPVIASRVGGIPEVVEDGRTGFLVPPGDDGGLAHRIDQLLEDEELRNLFSQRGSKRAIEFNWDSVADRVAIRYRSMKNAKCKLKNAK
ncbi:glycosyltransferase [candidate division WOR-3 bacterium]|nr:glycosyltransferase [candidate division WOR-3 bacterium]